MFIIDSKLSIHDKNSILAAFISKIPHEEIYMVPAVREFIQKNTDTDPELSKGETPDAGTGD